MTACSGHLAAGRRSRWEHRRCKLGGAHPLERVSRHCGGWAGGVAGVPTASQRTEQLGEPQGTLRTPLKLSAVIGERTGETTSRRGKNHPKERREGPQSPRSTGNPRRPPGSGDLRAHRLWPRTQRATRCPASVSRPLPKALRVPRQHRRTVWRGSRHDVRETRNSRERSECVPGKLFQGT